LISTFLQAESDHTCKRNAFAALVSISHEKALMYLSSVFDGIPNTDELLQLVELEFIRKDAIQNSQNKVLISQALAIFANSVGSIFTAHI
jgi:coatomer subunit beta